LALSWKQMKLKLPCYRRVADRIAMQSVYGLYRLRLVGRCSSSRSGFWLKNGKGRPRREARQGAGSASKAQDSGGPVCGQGDLDSWITALFRYRTDHTR